MYVVFYCVVVFGIMRRDESRLYIFLTCIGLGIAAAKVHIFFNTKKRASPVVGNARFYEIINGVDYHQLYTL